MRQQCVVIPGAGACMSHPLEVEHFARTQIPTETDSYHRRHLYRLALTQIQYYSIPCAQSVRLPRFFRGCFPKALQAAQSSKDATRAPARESGVQKHQPRLYAVCSSVHFPFHKTAGRKEAMRAVDVVVLDEYQVMSVGPTGERPHCPAEGLRGWASRAELFPSRRARVLR